jgi:hypothetical protein
MAFPCAGAAGGGGSGAFALIIRVGTPEVARLPGRTSLSRSGLPW